VLPRSQLTFLSKTWFLGIYLNFQQQKSLKNQYFPHTESKIYQINSIKFCSSRSFQQHQRHVPIPSKFSARIQFNFQLRNHSIFKNFCTASPTVMKPSGCTPPPQELSKDTKNVNWSIPVPWISSVQNKTNKLPSFIDRFEWYIAMGLLCVSTHFDENAHYQSLQ
jgi:hypothetical protein